MDYIKAFYYMFFVFFLTMLFSGYGSILERLKSHSSDWFIYLFAFIVSYLTIYFTSASMKKYISYEVVKYTIKHTTRIKYAISGTVLFLLGAIQLIWNIIPYSPFSRLHTYATAGLISWGTVFCYIALYDPARQKIDLKIFQRNDLNQESVIKQKYHYPNKKLKKRIYFWVFIGTLCSVVLGLIHIFKTNNQKEGYYQIIAGLFTIIFLVFLFEYIGKMSHENNNIDLDKKDEEQSS